MENIKNNITGEAQKKKRIKTAFSISVGNHVQDRGSSPPERLIASLIIQNRFRSIRNRFRSRGRSFGIEELIRCRFRIDSGANRRGGGVNDWLRPFPVHNWFPWMFDPVRGVVLSENVDDVRLIEKSWTMWQQQQGEVVATKGQRLLSFLTSIIEGQKNSKSDSGIKSVRDLPLPLIQNV